MHPNRKFHIADEAAMARFVADQGFGMLVAQGGDGLRAVHIPLLLTGPDRVQFHVSRGNLLHPILMSGCEALLIVNGPHAYISPDWYELPDRVPTWNYAAVELNGRVVPLERESLIELLDRMSDRFEERLQPKPVWKRDKMSPGRFDGLLKAIDGFELRIDHWRGTAKLDQDKPEEVRSRLAVALDGQGETEMARLMRP